MCISEFSSFLIPPSWLPQMMLQDVMQVMLEYVMQNDWLPLMDLAEEM